MHRQRQGQKALRIRRQSQCGGDPQTRPAGGCQKFHRQPLRCHILSAQMEQSTILLQDLNVSPKQVVVDLGFRGKEVDQANPDFEIIHRGRIKTMTKAQRRWLKRRQAVEPAIRHLKSDNRMQRCWLQGATGDALHALCCAVGYNLRWLMRAVVHLGLKGLLSCLLWLAYWVHLSVTKRTHAEVGDYGGPRHSGLTLVSFGANS
jgi:transposase, IS5 family